LFLWVILPEYLNANEILQKALERKVAFVPGTSFYADGAGHNTMRLNFSYVAPSVIEEGIHRLGSLLKEVIATASSAFSQTHASVQIT
jgi:2-aminoadipate transaminase